MLLLFAKHIVAADTTAGEHAGVASSSCAEPADQPATAAAALAFGAEPDGVASMWSHRDAPVRCVSAGCVMHQQRHQTLSAAGSVARYGRQREAPDKPTSEPQQQSADPTCGSGGCAILSVITGGVGDEWRNFHETLRRVQLAALAVVFALDQEALALAQVRRPPPISPRRPSQSAPPAARCGLGPAHLC